MKQAQVILILLFWCSQLWAIDIKQYDSNHLIYENETYKFSVIFPKYLSYCVTEAPAPDHGILFFLDDSIKNCEQYFINTLIPRISINAEYNVAFESGNPKDYINQLILLERNPIISQALWSSLYLDKLHAVRAVFKEEELMSHTLWINNIIAAQTNNKKTNISAILRTTKTRYANDLKSFNKLMDTFKLEKY
jgi:hypothetical protein